jgi:hypothetical protein
MKSPKKKRPSSLLGLSLDTGRLSGAVVRASGGTLETQNPFSFALSLDPLNHEPELVGREIRNLLDAAGAREKRCVVCLPLSWALTLQTKIPEISEADIPSFLQIEAERGFPYGLDALMIAESRFRTPSGDQYVTQVAVPREHVTRLQAALKAAKLNPLSFSLGITALSPADSVTTDGVIAVALGEDTAGLQVSFGGGVASLRILEGAYETEGAEKLMQPEQIAREIRITLGQLPSGLSAVARRLRVFGKSELARQLVENIRPFVGAMGLRLEQVETYAPADFRIPFKPGTMASPALSLAARFLSGSDSPFEFLPPKIGLWKQFTTRYSSKRLMYAGVSVGGAAVVVAIAFLVQQVQLMSLRAKWEVLQPVVKEIDDLQAQIRKYRPWFGEPVRTLNILRELTQAFPEDNSLTAKTFEIRDQNTITCTGTARDNTALFKAEDKLRAVKDISKVQTDSLQGKSPVQFTFSFHWGQDEGTEE